MSGAARVLCTLDDIEEGGALGFEDVGDAHHPGVFIVRKGGRVYGYVNDCPHWNVTLDYVPGRFMNRDKGMIQCANHGARFRIEDGVCDFGPCHGESLTPVRVAVDQGRVILMDNIGPENAPPGGTAEMGLKARGEGDES